MTDNWVRWEGRTIDGKYLLGNYVGESDGSAVFRTRNADGTGDAAIKFMAAESADADAQLRRWEMASRLSHPNLIRVMAAGRAVVDGREFVYAVEEFAAENLGQIIPERSLTAEESRGMLSAVLAALAYAHGKGMVHGPIRPADILAVGDDVKLSSDSLREAGKVPRAASVYDAPEVGVAGVSAASDVWSLGMTLAEVMTQRVPSWDAARMSPPEVEKGIAEPFRSIIVRCLEIDPERRCGIGEVRDRLEGVRAGGAAAGAGERLMQTAVPPAASSTVTWQRWMVPAAVVIALTGFLFVRSRGMKGTNAGENSAVQAPDMQQSPAQPVTAKAGPSNAEPGQAAASEAGAMASGEPPTSVRSRKNEIVKRVVPEVSRGARRTIHGRIRVLANVDVDADGNVSEARLTQSGSSNYFARTALDAARQWKFAPSADEGGKREWNLLFVFTRARTVATATPKKQN
jgi:TonB family protein